MSIAGAAFGASQSLEEILAAQMFKAKLAEQQQQDAQRMKLDEARLNETLRQNEIANKRQTMLDDRVLAGDREKNNAKEVRRMIGEGITRRVPLGDMQGMAFAEGINLPQEAKPKKVQYTYTDPKSGNKSLRFASEDQIPEGGLDMGNEPPKPEKPTQPDAPKAPGKPPVSMAAAIAAAKTSLAGLDRLETLYSDDKVGPVAGRYNKIERGAPQMIGGLMPDAPKDFEEFAAESATLKNQVIQAITGAAVGVAEQERIMGQIPDVTNNPSVWKARAKATRRNLQALMANQTQMGTGAAEAAPGATVDTPGTDEIVYQRDPKTGKLVRVGG